MEGKRRRLEEDLDLEFSPAEKKRKIEDTSPQKKEESKTEQVVSVSSIQNKMRELGVLKKFEGKENLTDAIKLIAKMKSKPEINFSEFAETLKKVMNKEALDHPELIFSEAKKAFKGDKELLEEFLNFLPEEYHKTVNQIDQHLQNGGKWKFEDEEYKEEDEEIVEIISQRRRKPKRKKAKKTVTQKSSNRKRGQIEEYHNSADFDPKANFTVLSPPRLRSRGKEKKKSYSYPSSFRTTNEEKSNSDDDFSDQFSGDVFRFEDDGHSSSSSQEADDEDEDFFIEEEMTPESRLEHLQNTKKSKRKRKKRKKRVSVSSSSQESERYEEEEEEEESDYGDNYHYFGLRSNEKDDKHECLNTQLKIHPRGGSFGISERSQYQQIITRLEDEKTEIDVTISQLDTFIKFLLPFFNNREACETKISQPFPHYTQFSTHTNSTISNTTNFSQPPKIQQIPLLIARMSELHKSCLTKFYDYHGMDVLIELIKRPLEVIPTILRRFTKKKMELEMIKKQFNLRFAKIYKFNQDNYDQLYYEQYQSQINKVKGKISKIFSKKRNSKQGRKALSILPRMPPNIYSYEGIHGFKFIDFTELMIEKLQNFTKFEELQITSFLNSQPNSPPNSRFESEKFLRNCESFFQKLKRNSKSFSSFHTFSNSHHSQNSQLYHHQHQQAQAKELNLVFQNSQGQDLKDEIMEEKKPKGTGENEEKKSLHHKIYDIFSNFLFTKKESSTDTTESTESTENLNYLIWNKFISQLFNLHHPFSSPPSQQQQQDQDTCQSQSHEGKFVLFFGDKQITQFLMSYCLFCDQFKRALEICRYRTIINNSKSKKIVRNYNKFFEFSYHGIGVLSKLSNLEEKEKERNKNKRKKKGKKKEKNKRGRGRSRGRKPKNNRNYEDKSVMEMYNRIDDIEDIVEEGVHERQEKEEVEEHNILLSLSSSSASSSSDSSSSGSSGEDDDGMSDEDNDDDLLDDSDKEEEELMKIESFLNFSDIEHQYLLLIKKFLLLKINEQQFLFFCKKMFGTECVIPIELITIYYPNFKLQMNKLFSSKTTTVWKFIELFITQNKTENMYKEKITQLANLNNLNQMYLSLYNTENQSLNIKQMKSKSVLDKLKQLRSKYNQIKSKITIF